MPSLLDMLGYAGNLLDLPGSSVRDLLSGNNPFDQWATPFSDQNRATGRDVLRPFLGDNEETGMSGWISNPMEGVKDIAGFGLEMAADPLNFVSLSPLWRALKGRKAVKGANAAQEAANAGRYGYVNPKVLNAVEDVAPEAVQQAGPKLLGYTPAPENPMFPGREVVHHGGHNWAGSATPQHPYGMMDLDRIHTGEGNTVKGPGGYFADDIRTTDRYYGMVANQAPGPDQKAVKDLYSRLQETFAPGRDIMLGGGQQFDDVIEQANNLSDDVFAKGPDGTNYQRSRYPVVGIRPVGWEGNSLTYDILHATPDGMATVRDNSYDFGFSENDWSEYFTGNPIPLVEPKPTRYTLDMPAGTKDRMMSWEGGMADQPQAVQNLVANHPATKLFDELDNLEKNVFSITQQMADVKKKYGINSFTPTPDDPAELVALREKLVQANDLVKAKEAEASNVAGSHYFFRQRMGGTPTGEKMADLLMGEQPAFAKFEHVTGLQQAGVPGMKNLATSTGKESYNYAIWDKDLINQMRIRAIDEQRVPINPMFGPVKAEQRIIPQIADSPLAEVINPMTPQPLPGLAKPAMQGAAYQALARFNSYGGSL